MTSAADLLPTKPAARPEPAAPKAASPKDDGASFADVLETETTASETPDSKEDVAAATDAVAAPVATQPASPLVTSAANSPEAILAGLTQAEPAPVAVDGTALAPSINTSAPPVPQPGANAAAAQAAAAAAPAQAAATAPAQAAVATAPAAKAATTPAAKPATPAAASDATDETDDTIDSAATPSADVAPVTPAGAITAAVTPVSTPTATTPQPETASLSAPGAERAAAAPIEAAPASTEKSPAAATGGAGTQTAAAKPASAATLAADAAPEIKADAAPPPATSTPADTLAAARTPTTDTARATQTPPALQNAPPATVQVYQRMVERFDGRAQRYEIRLDPAELGRVDVRIEVGADKKVHAVLAAHDSAALTDLMRGQRSLERALADAGIDVADGGIKFELSNNPNRNASGDQTASERNASANVWRGFSTLDVAVDHQTAAAARPWRPSSRFDLVA